MRSRCLLLLLIAGHLGGAQAQSPAQTPAPTSAAPAPRAPGVGTAARPRPLPDEQLLDLVQRQTLRYFWDFGHPVSGLARERSNVAYDYGQEVVTTGGTGFGVLAIIVGTERGWLPRPAAAARVSKIVGFLVKADHYHGAFPHWLNGETGRVVPFSPQDDGADLVETSFLFEGLLCARQYFTRNTPTETRLRADIQRLWEAVEWNWFTQGGQNVLYWHWSPNNGWRMNHQIHGWNECLITYVLAAGGAPRFAIEPAVYAQGWASGPDFVNAGPAAYGQHPPLGPPLGGPLFFSHYSFLGLDPHGLRDEHADYWQQNLAQTRLNYAYCVANPKHYPGYGPACWGLTASDSYQGYAAHSPSEDLGVISPTAALSAMPYAPELAWPALRHFYFDLGDKIWGDYGFVDAFSEAHDWQAASYLAIDQGPVVGMLENYRSGLLWKLFMSAPEVQRGLRRLSFRSPHLAAIKPSKPTKSAKSSKPARHN